MDHITDQIWLGDASDAINIPLLKQAKITAVLSVLRESLGMPDWHGAGIQHAQFPMADGETHQGQYIQMAVETLDSFIKEGHIVLVHCGAGISRSSTTVITYLIYSGKFEDWRSAEDFVGSKRPVIFPHPFLRRAAKRFLKLWPYDGTYALDQMADFKEAGIHITDLEELNNSLRKNAKGET